MEIPVYTIFVGDLSIYCKKDDLINVFSSFGPIRDVRIKKDEVTGKNLSYGFIEFVEVTSAVNVLKNMNGFVLCGRPLRVRWAANKPKNASQTPSSSIISTQMNATSPVYVTYTVLKPEIIVTEEYLRYIFSRYGFVLDATIKKASTCGQHNRPQHHHDRSSCKGYGFVHFANTQDGVESAIRAATAMANVTMDNVNFKCCLSKILEQRLNTLMYEHRSLSPAEVYAMNCYLYAQHQQCAMLYASALCVQGSGAVAATSVPSPRSQYYYPPTVMTAPVAIVEPISPVASIGGQCSFDAFDYPFSIPPAMMSMASTTSSEQAESVTEEVSAETKEAVPVEKATSTTTTTTKVKTVEVEFEVEMPSVKCASSEPVTSSSSKKASSDRSDVAAAVNSLQSQLNDLRLTIGADMLRTSVEKPELHVTVEPDHLLVCADICDY